MNEITQISPQVKDKRRCNIYIDGKFCCGLTLETAVKNRLKVGVCITPERLSQIQLESEKNTALDKALTHLSATKKTEKQMREFLQKKGYLEGVIEYVLEKLRGYNFVNDGEYAEEYASFASKKKGLRLVERELMQKGIDKESIENALSTVDGEAQEECARAILQKYMRAKTADRETLAKAYRYLLSKGFSYELAKSVIGEYGQVEEDDE